MVAIVLEWFMKDVHLLESVNFTYISVLYLIIHIFIYGSRMRELIFPLMVHLISSQECYPWYQLII